MSGLKACNRDLWSPHVLTRSVLSAWWNADDHGTARMTDDGAGLISNWVDRIGGLALTAVTTARPTWASASFNTSKAGITFDGAVNCFVTTTLTSPTGANASEIWVVATATVAQNATLLAYGGSTNGTLRNVAMTSAFKVRSGDGTNLNIDTSSNLISSPSVVNGQLFGTTVNGWINGNAFTANPTTIPTLNTGTTRMRVASTTGGSASSFFGGVVRHVMILNGTLTAADRQRLEGYFAWDGGFQASLPVSCPYQRFRP